MTNFKCGVLDAWVQGLPASGRYTFTRQEAMQATGLTHGAFRLVSMRLSSQRVIVRLHQNLYAVIPLEYRAVGVLPAEWVVDDLLVHIGQKYYLGLLTAAALHGAAHQHPRVCQVVTDRPVRPVEVHGMGIRFYVSNRLAETDTVQIKGEVGYLPVSTPEETAFDLVRYSRQLGGLSQVATVLQELGEKLNGDKLGEVAIRRDRLPETQRLGWLLERGGFNAAAYPLHEWLSTQKKEYVPLALSSSIQGATRDSRWKLWLNEEIEEDL